MGNSAGPACAYAVMFVQELWRYPVKSMRGERLDSAELGVDGVRGDRLVHAREARGRVVTSRYRPGLLGLSGTLGPDGEPLVDGEPWGSPQTLAKVRAVTSPDVELVRFNGLDSGQRYDVLPLTVLTDGMARAVGVDHRRFRPNLLIGGVTGARRADLAGRVPRDRRRAGRRAQATVALRDDDVRSRHARAGSLGAAPCRPLVRRHRRARLLGRAARKDRRRRSGYSAAMNTRIAILGTGRLGESMLRGFLSSGWRQPADISVTARREEHLAELREKYEGVAVEASNTAALRGRGSRDRVREAAGHGGGARGDRRGAASRSRPCSRPPRA